MDIRQHPGSSRDADFGNHYRVVVVAFFLTERRNKHILLSRLKTAGAALLSTSHGQAFETNVGNADIIKLYATLASPQMSEDSSVSSENSAGDSGASGTSATPTPTPVPREGANCVMAGESAPTTLVGKIRVLNCLVFYTPRSFWATQSTKTKTGNDLATAGNPSRYGFLGYGDWEYSRVPDGPFLPACLRHDVSYSSLRKFVEDVNPPDNEGDNYFVDATWNPRNKYLADFRFQQDLDVELKILGGRLACSNYILSPKAYLACKAVSAGFHVKALAMHYAVTHPLGGHGGQPSNWHVTDEIISDVKSAPRYIVIGSP